MELICLWNLVKQTLFGLLKCPKLCFTLIHVVLNVKL